jgi:hypothetical protein
MYIFGKFFPFWYVVSKNLATLTYTSTYVETLLSKLDMHFLCVSLRKINASKIFKKHGPFERVFNVLCSQDVLFKPRVRLTLTAGPIFSHCWSMYQKRLQPKKGENKFSFNAETLFPAVFFLLSSLVQDTGRG